MFIMMRILAIVMNLMIFDDVGDYFRLPCRFPTVMLKIGDKCIKLFANLYPSPTSVTNIDVANLSQQKTRFLKKKAIFER